MEWARSPEAWDVPTRLEWESGWEGPTRMKGARAPLGWDAPTGREQDQWGEMRSPEWNGQETQLGGMRPPEWNGQEAWGHPLQNGICQRPVGVGHTHWNRNEPKPDEEWEVGCYPSGVHGLGLLRVVTHKSIGGGALVGVAKWRAQSWATRK